MSIQQSLDELGLGEADGTALVSFTGEIDYRWTDPGLPTDYIDLFLMHSPLSGREKRVSTWKFLNEIMQEEGPKGRVRSVGVSNL